MLVITIQCKYKGGQKMIIGAKGSGVDFPKMRNVSEIELRGIIRGTIPVCDHFGDYSATGLAVVQKNGKYGVVDKTPKLIFKIEHDSAEVMPDGSVELTKGNETYYYDGAGRFIGITVKDRKN